MNLRNRLVTCLAATAVSVGLAAAVIPATSTPSADTGWGVVKNVKTQSTTADTGWGITTTNPGRV